MSVGSINCTLGMDELCSVLVIFQCYDSNHGVSSNSCWYLIPNATLLRCVTLGKQSTIMDEWISLHKKLQWKFAFLTLSFFYKTVFSPSGDAVIRRYLGNVDWALYRHQIWQCLHLGLVSHHNCEKYIFVIYKSVWYFVLTSQMD